MKIRLLRRVRKRYEIKKIEEFGQDITYMLIDNNTSFRDIECDSYEKAFKRL
jgi:hypothetical protein